MILGLQDSVSLQRLVSAAARGPGVRHGSHLWVHAVGATLAAAYGCMWLRWVGVVGGAALCLGAAIGACGRLCSAAVWAGWALFMTFKRTGTGRCYLSGAQGVAMAWSMCYGFIYILLWSGEVCSVWRLVASTAHDAVYGGRVWGSGVCVLFCHSDLCCSGFVCCCPCFVAVPQGRVIL